MCDDLFLSISLAAHMYIEWLVRWSTVSIIFKLEDLVFQHSGSTAVLWFIILIIYIYILYTRTKKLRKPIIVSNFLTSSQSPIIYSKLVSCFPPCSYSDIYNAPLWCLNLFSSLIWLITADDGDFKTPVVSIVYSLADWVFCR